jgi:hypothetical protein
VDITVVINQDSSYSAHITGCGDIARAVAERNVDHLGEVASRKAVVEELFQGFESLEDEGWEYFVGTGEIRFPHCVRALPKGE